MTNEIANRYMLDTNMVRQKTRCKKAKHRCTRVFDSR